MTRRTVGKKTDGSIDWEGAVVEACNINYPGASSDNIGIVEINLVDVRAARSIRVYYDFERDGYVVSAIINDPDERIVLGDERWLEKAFVPAWEEG